MLYCNQKNTGVFNNMGRPVFIEWEGTFAFEENHRSGKAEPGTLKPGDFDFVEIIGDGAMLHTYIPEGNYVKHCRKWIPNAYDVNVSETIDRFCQYEEKWWG